MLDKMDTGFFDSEEALDVLERFAAADSMTVIVGAGVSAEARLPTWNDLISAMLRDAAGRLDPRISEDEIGHWIEWVMRTEGLPGTGTIVQMLLGDEFLERLRYHLYVDSGDQPIPGPTAHQIARLQESAIGRIEVLTTNYDDLIEAALKSRGVPVKRIKSYVNRTQPRDSDQFVIRHLHGILTPTERRGNVVLSDADYFGMQAPYRWQEKHMRNRLEGSPCLFLGTSLTDPNLLRYLYRSSPDEATTVVFTRQGEWVPTSPTPGIRRAHESAAQIRWNKAGVKALHADYYSEVAQLAYELSLRRECLSSNTPYRGYRDRITNWHNELSEALLQVRHLDGFRLAQDALQKLLEDVLDQVETNVLSSAGIHRGRDETLALHLWIHDPFDRTLTLWASSDRSWRDPRTLVPVPIQRPTQWISVETFCTGAPMTRSTADDDSSRWNHVRAVPVRLDAEPEVVAAGSDLWGFLPVGVITMASTRPEGSSVLTEVDLATLNEIDQLLASVASDILTPEP